MVRKLLYAAFIALAPEVAHADPSPSDYVCNILDVRNLSRDGRIVDESTFKITIGMQFGVRRTTGEIFGKPLSNSNANGTPRVLDIGSREQAYKVITIYEPFISVSYLQINEYEDGLDKPFIFYDVRTIYSGLCRHSF